MLLALALAGSGFGIYGPSGGHVARASDDVTLTPVGYLLDGIYTSSVAFAKIGNNLYLAAGTYSSGNRGVYVWEITQEGFQPVFTATGQPAGVNAVAFSPDGRRLAAALDGPWGGGLVKIWTDWYTPDASLRSIEAHLCCIQAVVFSPDGQRFATAGLETTSADRVKIWDAETGNFVGELTSYPYNYSSVYSVAFSPDGTQVAFGGNLTGTQDGGLFVGPSAGGEASVAATATGVDVRPVAFSPDGSMLAAGSLDAKIRIWNTSSWSLVQTLTGHSSWLMSVAFSPDGRYLASADLNGGIRLWDTATWQQAAIASVPGEPELTFSPDGQYLAAASPDGVTVWRLEQSVELNVTANPDSLSLDDLIRSPDFTVQFQVQAFRGGVPLDHEPIEVIGPDVGTLELPANPMINGGTFSFSWHPPDASYFQSRILPESFFFIVEVGGVSRTTSVTVGPGSSVTLFVIASPSVLTLRDIAENRPVDFTVTLAENNEPLEGERIEVDAPSVGTLAMPDPAITDANGELLFHWLPPELEYFENRLLPEEFAFVVRGADQTQTVRVTVSDRGWKIRGRVVMRHAGADPSDPEGDGIKPVAGAAVSISPDFAESTLSDQDGRFELEVRRPGIYTVYARKLNAEPPPTQTRQTGIEVREENEVTELDEPLYLANLGVGRQMEHTFIPFLDHYSNSTSLEHLLGLSLPTNPQPDVQQFLNALRQTDETRSWDEEALRRLNLSEFAAYEGARAAEQVSTFAAREIWDGTFGAIGRLISKNLENIKVLQLAKDCLKTQIQTLEQSQTNPSKLQQLRKTLKMIETAEQRCLELNKKLNQVLYLLYSRLAVPSVNASGLSRQHRALVLNVAKFLNEQLKAKTLDEVREILTNAPGGQQAAALLENIQQQVDQQIALMQQQFAKYLAFGFRKEINLAVGQAVDWATAGDFPQHPISYAMAELDTQSAMRRQQEIAQRISEMIGRYEATKTFVDGVIEDWDAWGKTLIVAVTAGSASHLMATVDKVLDVVQALEPLAQVGAGLAAVAPIAEDGELTRATVDSIRMAFSKSGQVRVSVHSPVHLMAVDRFGRRTGIDASGRRYTEIPGAYHKPSSADEPEALVLPDNPSSYRIFVFGTGNGSYTLEVGRRDANGTFVPSRTWIGTATPGSLSAAEVSVGSGGVEADEALVTPSAAERLAIFNAEGNEITSLELESGQQIRLWASPLDTAGKPTSGHETIEWLIETGNASLSILPSDSDRSVVLEARAAGQTIVRARYGQLLSAPLTVTIAPSRPRVVRLTAEPQLVQAGQTVSLRAEVSDGYNPLEGWTVSFVDTASGESIGAATTSGTGTAELQWTVPIQASGPLTVMASVDVPDEDLVLGLTTLSVRSPAAEQPPAGMQIDAITGDNGPIGSLHVPPAAFASAAEPIWNAQVLVENAGAPSAEELEVLNKVVPPRPPSLRLVGPVLDISAVDLASGRALQPESPLLLHLNSPVPLAPNVGVYTAVYGEEGWRWEKLATRSSGPGWIEVDVPHLSLFALMEDHQNDNPVGLEGGSGESQTGGYSGTVVLSVQDVERALSTAGDAVVLDLSNLPLGRDKAVALRAVPEAWNLIRRAGKNVVFRFAGVRIEVPRGALESFTDASGGLQLKVSAAEPPLPIRIGPLAELRSASPSFRIEGAKVAASSFNVSIRTDILASYPTDFGAMRKVGGYIRTPDGMWQYLGGRMEEDGWLVFRTETFQGPFAAFLYIRTFADISGHWAQDAVETLAARHIIQGRSDDRYEPDMPLTRGELAALLTHAFAVRLDSASAVPFADVSQNAWYRDAVAAVRERGWMIGDGNAFRPDAPITREEMAVAVARTIGWNGQPSSTAPTFTDRADISAWATDAVGFLQEQGLVSGTGEGLFMPKAAASRAQAATLLYRALFSRSEKPLNERSG